LKSHDEEQGGVAHFVCACSNFHTAQKDWRFLEAGVRAMSSVAKNPHLVVTVHGIRTYGQWQSRLKSLLEQTEPGITVRNAKYGYFSILAFIFPFTRWLVTRRFRRELLNVIQSQSWSRIDLVGHSFGTHLLAWALHGVAREKRPRIHTIILAGSVLKSTFPWDLFHRPLKRNRAHRSA
jgi:hypothetical protein